MFHGEADFEAKTGRNLKKPPNKRLRPHDKTKGRTQIDFPSKLIPERFPRVLPGGSQALGGSVARFFEHFTFFVNTEPQRRPSFCSLLYPHSRQDTERIWLPCDQRLVRHEGAPPSILVFRADAILRALC